ncbi:MAG: N-6 DNA methylase, partial [Desulfobacterales bacterium]|nr:N-6 DNA methylase [Candidatus Desulfatibia vada]
MPADILGQVYEEFLGKIIRLTPKHQAKIEEKPEVRKAGGVYYTPTYIVDYIVKNTVGKLVEGKKPGPRGGVGKLRILDSACGSGSFLIGAYQLLLGWHRDQYVKDGAEKWAKGKTPRVYQSQKGEWRLTTDERKRILLNNIYGVDIDHQAVEVTKLSLLLKVLEGEDEQSIGKQMALFQERVLPDLSNNIKCGNSLIGPDFYENRQMSLLDEEEMYRVNSFDWDAEFPEIMKKGGFDAVIGNPPYISVESINKGVTEYYLKSYQTAYGRVNSFSLFIEKSVSLLKHSGFCGLITSNRILTNTQLSSLRKLLLKETFIENILTFQKSVFKAAVDTTVLTFQKGKIPDKQSSIKILYNIIKLENNEYQLNRVKHLTYMNNYGHIFNVKQKEEFTKIIKIIEKKSIYLENICEVKDGIILGSIKDLFLSDSAIDNRYEKWLEGNEVSRYHIQWTGHYICYDDSLIKEELKRKREKARKNALDDKDFKKLSRSGIWLRKPEIFKKEKILTRQNAKKLIGVYDDENYFVKNSLHCIILINKYPFVSEFMSQNLVSITLHG